MAGKKQVSPVAIEAHNKHPTVVNYVNFTESNFTEKKISVPVAKPIELNAHGMQWLHIEGLQDVGTIETIAKQFRLHPLTLEDILHVRQRPKVEEYEDYLFITMKGLQWKRKQNNFSMQQVSIVIGKHFILSFVEYKTKLFVPLKNRLRNPANKRLRQQGSDYLSYRMLDAIVDVYFDVLEAIGNRIEHIEESIFERPEVQSVKKYLSY